MSRRVPRECKCLDYLAGEQHPTAGERARTEVDETLWQEDPDQRVPHAQSTNGDEPEDTVAEHDVEHGRGRRVGEHIGVLGSLPECEHANEDLEKDGGGEDESKDFGRGFNRAHA